MSIVSGFGNIFKSVTMMVFGIMLSMTIIGLLWGPALIMAGGGYWVAGMAQLAGGAGKAAFDAHKRAKSDQ